MWKGLMLRCKNWSRAVNGGVIANVESMSKTRLNVFWS